MEKTKSMGEKKTAPKTKKGMMSIGDLFSKTIDSFSKQAEPLLLSSLVFLGIYIVLGILFVIAMLAFGIGAAGLGFFGATKDSSELIASGAAVGGLFFVVMLVGYLIMIVIQGWHTASLVGISSEYEKGKVLKVKEALKMGWGYVWKFFGMGVLLGIILIVGFILLIIPGLILGVMYSVAPYAMINEKLGVVESLRRSWQLVKGNFWPVVGRQLIIMLIGMVVGLIAGFIPFLNMIIMFVWLPIVIVYNYLIYKDLVKAKK